MENHSGASRNGSFDCLATRGQNPLPPKWPLQYNSPSNNANQMPSCRVDHSQCFPEPPHHHHHRSSSDSFLTEQPTWLDDLLNEPVENEMSLYRGLHRRSSSESAFLDVIVDARKEEYNPAPQTFISPSSTSYKPGRVASKAKQNKHDPADGSSGKQNGSNPNHSAPKADSKRAKQQHAQRSRLRKLQYIAELERHVQILQAEGSQASAALEYLDHQFLMLDMENRALKQHLEGLSQEQHMQHSEKDMLEREIARLQFIYQQQQKQKHFTQACTYKI